MSKFYPNIGNKSKIKNITCEKCKEYVSSGFLIDIKHSWFRGEDDHFKLCDKCAEAKTKEVDNIYKDWEKRRNNWYEKNKARLEKQARERKEREEKKWRKIEKKYGEIKKLTPYQVRICGALDIFPTNRKYHDIKNQTRGEYQNLDNFLKTFFKLI